MKLRLVKSIPFAADYLVFDVYEGDVDNDPTSPYYGKPVIGASIRRAKPIVGVDAPPEYHQATIGFWCPDINRDEAVETMIQNLQGLIDLLRTDVRV